MTCGRPLAEPAEQPQLAGLETTRQSEVEVAAAALAGLEPTRQTEVEVAAAALGGLEPTARETVGEVAPAQVPDLEPSRYRGLGETTSVPARRVCLECSVPNPLDRVLCLSCGKRL